MPEPRYPEAVWDPGVNAGYRAGRNVITTAVCHYTVGRDSRPIGRRGYFQFLVSRDGTVTQFAEADAVCWHAGTPWNFRGPGIEVEYLDEDVIFTPAADRATGELVGWLHAEWGVPLDFYDGPRINSWSGFITHRSLIQTGDAHSDYWPYLPLPDVAPEDSEEMNSSLIKDTAGDVWVYDYDAHTKTLLDAQGFLGQIELRRLVLQFGGKADVTVHGVGENNGLWGRLLGDAHDVRTVGGAGSFPTSGTWTAR